MHSIDDHPKRVTLASDIPQRLQNCSSFRWKAEEFSTLLPPELQHRQNINFSSPPWQHSTPHEARIATKVPGITGWDDDTNQKRWWSLTTIASYQADYVIYSDGSASQGTRNGGAAAVIARGSPLQSEVVTTIWSKGRTFTSSYEEEAAAMGSALSWTSTNANHPLISILLHRQQILMSSSHFIKSSTFSIYNSISSEVQDLFHWLCKCPALMIIRQRVVGNHQGSLDWLANRPGDLVTYTRKTLVNFDA